jgi:hypothetical protein
MRRTLGFEPAYTSEGAFETFARRHAREVDVA